MQEVEKEMNKVKAYFEAGVGVGKMNIGNTATISFEVEVVNEHPNKNLPII